MKQTSTEKTEERKPYNKNHRNQVTKLKQKQYTAMFKTKLLEKTERITQLLKEKTERK